MWLSNFLDFTVFEIRNVQQKLYFRKLESFKTLVHHYNPFTNKYFKKMCSLTTIWFPNKLLNLHGNQIKGGLYFIPPFSLATYNKVGHLQSCSGADVDMFNSLSEVMNFSTYIESDVNSTIGTFHGNEATGMLELLINNEINILITSTINFRPSTEGGLYGFSTNFDVVSIVAFVSISNKNVDEQFLNFKVLWFRILLYIGFVIVMWTVIVNIDNEENSWKPEYIAAIILGVTIPKQPNPVQHRIIFLYFIAIGFYCSISFLGGLTANKVKISDEVQLETFQDLAESNLRPYIYTNIDKYLNDDSEDLQILRKRVVPTPYVDTECIAMLIKYRNVSCLIFDSYARLLVEIIKDESGHPITKILKPIIFNTRRVIVLERNSPYKERLDQLITIFVESGLRREWENNISNDMFILNLFGLNRYNDSMLLQVTDLGSVSNLWKILILVVLSGYLLSFLVFAAEIFCHT